MSNMDWMRENFKKTPGYACSPGKRNFPEMSFHNTSAVKGYADGGQGMTHISINKDDKEEKDKFFPDLGEVLKTVALLAIGKGMNDGGGVKGFENGGPVKKPPELFHNTYTSFLGLKDWHKRDGEPAPIEDRSPKITETKPTFSADSASEKSSVKEVSPISTGPTAVKENPAVNEPVASAQSGSRDAVISDPEGNPDANRAEVPSVYRASHDSQSASADPRNKYSVQEYKANKTKIDETNQLRANNDKREKAFAEAEAKKAADKAEAKKAADKAKAAKPVDATDYVSRDTAAISMPSGSSNSILPSNPSASPVAVNRPFATTSTASRSVPIASRSVKTESQPKVKLVGDRFEYPADKVIDPIRDNEGVWGYPLRDNDPRWKLPIPKN